MLKFTKLATAVVFTASLSGAALAAEKLKVGFVYVGPVGDHGFTYQHEQGRLALQKAGLIVVASAINFTLRF